MITKNLKEALMHKLTLILFLITTNALASEVFTFGEISLKGSGCKRGTAQVVKSPDQQVVSILFDEFSVEVPNISGDNDNDKLDMDNPSPMSRFSEKLDHKTCNIVLNTNLTSEEKVTHIEVTMDFRGFTQVEKGAMAQFKGRLMNWNGPQRSLKSLKQVFANKIWKAGQDDDWALTKTVTIPVNGPCSKKGDRKFKAVINTTLQARLLGRRPIEEAFAMAAMDSGDLTGTLKMKIKTAKCRGRYTPPRRRYVPSRRRYAPSRSRYSSRRYGSSRRR
jgi:hypothetical protein